MFYRILKSKHSLFSKRAFVFDVASFALQYCENEGTTDKKTTQKDGTESRETQKILQCMHVNQLCLHALH